MGVPERLQMRMSGGGPWSVGGDVPAKSSLPEDDEGSMMGTHGLGGISFGMIAPPFT